MPKFIVITDTHIDDPTPNGDSEWWNRVLLRQAGSTIADAWVNEIRRRSPDFVLHCGDVTNDGQTASARRARGILDRLDCPCVVALGNHDTTRDPATRKTVCDVFGYPNGCSPWATDLSGIRVIVFPFALDLSVADTESHLVWLEDELRGSDTVPAIFLTHAPLDLDLQDRDGSPPRCRPEHETVAEHLPAYLMPGRERILSLLGKRRNVIGVFTGHTHTSDLTFPRGLLHCVTPSMIEYPFALREVVIRGNRVEVTTVVPEPSFAAQSLLPERNNTWVEGDATTQRFTHVF
ncbi:metallophosphoesterase family protein [Verrucomicrobiota bacterium]